MAGICFYFEDNDADVYSGRKIDLDAWNYACKVAGDVDQMIVINRTASELTTPDSDMDFQVVTELPELENSIKVCCEWDRIDSTPLWNFDHQVDWYVFGPSEGWTETGGSGIHIPVNGKVALHAVHAASVVLTHRYGTLLWQ